MQRNAIAHRFVFYASEVSYEERLYVAGDPDVIPDATPFGRPPEHMAGPQGQQARLKPGLIVYWHHLRQRGDLRGVANDDRSRASRGYSFAAQQSSFPIAGR